VLKRPGNSGPIDQGWSGFDQAGQNYDALFTDTVKYGTEAPKRGASVVEICGVVLTG